MRLLLRTALLKMKSQNGFALVELIITLSLLSIIMALGYTFFSFGTGSYDTGGSQQNVQQNVRNLANAITDEVRFATNIQIIDDASNIPLNDGNYYIFLQNDKIYFQDIDGDRAVMPVVIEDGTVINSLSFTGTGNYILDFTINASKNQQTYQVASSVQPLNLTGPITGIDDGEALGFSTQDIRMLASPNSITSGTYPELKIRLDLINCELANNIGVGDIGLDGAFGGLSLDEVIKISATQFEITFQENATINQGEGIITIDQGALDIDYDLTTSVTVSSPEPHSINIVGNGSIIIPEPEEDDETETYTATVFDQQGYEITDENVTWSLGEQVDGVSINESGKVTVDSDAEEGSFTVVATSASNNDIEGTLGVDLVPATTIQVGDPAITFNTTTELHIDFGVNIDNPEIDEDSSMVPSNITPIIINDTVLKLELIDDPSNDDEVYFSVEIGGTTHNYSVTFRNPGHRWGDLTFEENGSAGGEGSLCGFKSSFTASTTGNHHRVELTAKSDNNLPIYDLSIAEPFSNNWDLTKSDDPHDHTDLSIKNIERSDNEYTITVENIQQTRDVYRVRFRYSEDTDWIVITPDATQP